jgi:hypothetical protein
MKNISKNKNVSYVFELELSDKKFKTVSVNDLPVHSATGVEKADLVKWMDDGDDIKIENLLKLANNHQLFHNASSAHKALARKVAEGSMKREELETWVYSHDFDSEGKKSVSKAEKIAKLLNIPLAAAQAIVDAQGE